jgi:hypothetical protein
LNNLSIIPGKLAIASATRNPGVRAAGLKPAPTTYLLSRHPASFCSRLASKPASSQKSELPYSGIFALYNGQLKLMRYEVNHDTTLSDGKVFFDMTSAPGEDAINGIKLDQQGNLYVSGPGGLWIISSLGKHLGTIVVPKHPHNLAWGGDDGKTLYMTAQRTLYRMPLNIPGIRPGAENHSLASQR